MRFRYLYNCYIVPTTEYTHRNRIRSRSWQKRTRIVIEIFLPKPRYRSTRRQCRTFWSRLQAQKTYLQQMKMKQSIKMSRVLHNTLHCWWMNSVSDLFLNRRLHWPMRFTHNIVVENTLYCVSFQLNFTRANIYATPLSPAIQKSYVIKM